MTLHLQTVEARKGLLWIRHGLKVYRRRPLILTALYASIAVVALLLSQLPAPLTWVAPMLLPLLSLGFMLATHAVLQGQIPTVTVYLAPFRLTAARSKAQLLLCVSYGALLTLALLFAQGIAADAAQHVSTVMNQTPQDEAAILAAVTDPRLIQGQLLTLLSVAVLAVPFWHAPALVHWAGQGLAQALFSSTLAVWRNRGAFALYVLGWLGIGFILGLIALLLGAVFGGEVAQVLVAFACMLVNVALYSSLYFSFVDCFMFSPEEIKV